METVTFFFGVLCAKRGRNREAFTSPLNKNYQPGVYVCAACKTPLYLSEHKFDSGTGWPSFDRAITNSVELDVDYKIGYARTELKCATCGGHLGHSFQMVRRNNGERHCINGVALNFVPKKKISGSCHYCHNITQGNLKEGLIK